MSLGLTRAAVKHEVLGWSKKRPKSRTFLASLWVDQKARCAGQGRMASGSSAICMALLDQQPASRTGWKE
jgi:hypothetical protein